VFDVHIWRIFPKKEDRKKKNEVCYYNSTPKIKKGEKEAKVRDAIYAIPMT